MARDSRVESTDAVLSEPKLAQRRKRKGWIYRFKEWTDVRREKRIRIATQALIYGLALLTFLALVYALTQSQR
ncbi:MAG: hypothetical protein ACR2NN_16385 [Bryobacteraceae bacterium]